MRTIKARLEKLEQQVTTNEPPTFKVVWPDGSETPEAPAPAGDWRGLLVIRVIYEENNANHTR